MIVEDVMSVRAVGEVPERFQFRLHHLCNQSCLGDVAIPVPPEVLLRADHQIDDAVPVATPGNIEIQLEVKELLKRVTDKVLVNCVAVRALPRQGERRLWVAGCGNLQTSVIVKTAVRG